MKIKALRISVLALAIIAVSAVGTVSSQYTDPIEVQDMISNENGPSGSLEWMLYQPYSDDDQDSAYELYINEVMADNDITIEGPGGDYPDWIELYNAGSETIDLSGMCLTDDLTRPIMWRFPMDTEIGAGEYLIIWAEGSPGDDGLHAPFRLNANGDTIALFDLDGSTLIDSVTFHKQIRDTSFGRDPDGGDEWAYMSSPTPGSGNDANGEDGSPWTVPVAIVASAAMMIAVIAFIEHRRPRK